MKNQRQKGFTLIELLVLIAIIGILSQIVLANLRNATNKANRSSALATVSGLSGELDMCMNSPKAIYKDRLIYLLGQALFAHLANQLINGRHW